MNKNIGVVKGAIMAHYQPPLVSYKGQDREVIERNKLLDQQNTELHLQNDQLKVQNKHLQILADQAVKAAQSSERSAKHSKVCTTISLVIAGLMFVTAVLGVAFDIVSFNRSRHISETPTSQARLMQSYRE